MLVQASKAEKLYIIVIQYWGKRVRSCYKSLVWKRPSDIEW